MAEEDVLSWYIILLQNSAGRIYVELGQTLAQYLKQQAMKRKFLESLHESKSSDGEYNIEHITVAYNIL